MNLGDCYQLLELTFGATLAEVKASYRRLARQCHPDLNPCASAHDRFIQLQRAYETLRQVAPTTIAPLYRSYTANSPPYPGSVSPTGYRSPVTDPTHSPQPYPPPAHPHATPNPASPQYSAYRAHRPRRPHYGAATPPDFRSTARRSSPEAYSHPHSAPAESSSPHPKRHSSPHQTASHPQSHSPKNPVGKSGENSGDQCGVHAAPQDTKTTQRSQPESVSANLSPLDRQLKRRTYQRLQQLLKQHRFPHAIALVEGLAQRLPQDVEVRQWKAVTYQCFGRYCTAIEKYSKAQVYLTKAYRTDPHNRELLATLTQDLRYLDLRRRQSWRSKLS